MTNADAFFAAARELGERISAERRARRETLRLERNARRRARRAAAPKREPVKVPAVVTDADDYEVADGCRCHIVRMPPCGWCESGAGFSDD